MELFWVQHLAMLIVPIFLVATQARQKDHLTNPKVISFFQSNFFSAPAVGSLHAALLSYAIFFLYHLLILQVMIKASYFTITPKIRCHFIFDAIAFPSTYPGR